MSESSTGKEFWSCTGAVIAALIMGLASLMVADKIPVPDIFLPTETPMPISYIEITNFLLLPAEITIDGEVRGVVDNGQTIQFSITRYPVIVEQSVINAITSSGESLGDDMSGYWDTVNKESHLTITNEIGDQSYFYPVFTNDSNRECNIIINDGYISEKNAGWAKPHTKTVMGYYRLYSNSNVTLYCWNDERYVYWGIHPNDTTNGDKLVPDQTTGMIEFRYSE